MDNKTKTTSATELTESWYLVDATGLRIGRIASTVAELLLGKNVPAQRAYLLPRTKVVVINAALVDMTARKKALKTYTNYSGYPGGLRTLTLGQMLDKHPERPLEKAIKGMLPKNKRGNHIFDSNLYVYEGAEHKHGPQNPQLIDIKKFKL